MRSCLANDGLKTGSFRPPPDAAFGFEPKLYRIPYWLKGGEGVNLTICQQITRYNPQLPSAKVGAELENGRLAPVTPSRPGSQRVSDTRRSGRRICAATSALVPPSLRSSRTGPCFFAPRPHRGNCCDWTLNFPKLSKHSLKPKTKK